MHLIDECQCRAIGGGQSDPIAKAPRFKSMPAPEPVPPPYQLPELM